MFCRCSRLAKVKVKKEASHSSLGNKLLETLRFQDESDYEYKSCFTYCQIVEHPGMLNCTFCHQKSYNQLQKC